MTIAFLALGSNIEPEKNILRAIRLLSDHVTILKSSTVYLTEPLLQKKQPRYYNCVIEIATDTEPHILKLEVIRPIEEALGRQRQEDKYTSRTIDIDLIIYGNLYISNNTLQLPDPEIEKRPFLAIPLAEIEPELLLPPSNRPIAEIARKFKQAQLASLRDFTKTLRTLIDELREENS